MEATQATAPTHLSSVTSQNSSSNDSLDLIRKRSFSHVAWGAAPTAWYPKKKVLKSRITNDAFQLGQPLNSVLFQRRVFSRKADQGLICNPDGWQGDFENQLRFQARMAENQTWRDERGVSLGGADGFRTIDWQKSNTSQEVSVSPFTILTSLVDDDFDPNIFFDFDFSIDITESFDGTSTHPNTPQHVHSIDADIFQPQTPSISDRSISQIEPTTQLTHATESVDGTRHGYQEVIPNETFLSRQSPNLITDPTRQSTFSLARFIDTNAPGLRSFTSLRSLGSPPPVPIRNPARLTAGPPPIPVRTSSRLHLLMLETATASGARRPTTNADSGSIAAIASIAHDIDPIHEIGTATTLTMQRPPPARIVLVRGVEFEMESRSGTKMAEGFEQSVGSTPQSQETASADRSNLWSDLTRRFRHC